MNGRSVWRGAAVLAAGALLTLPAEAEEAQTWLSAGVEAEATPGIQVSLTPQLRWDLDTMALAQLNTTLALAFRPLAQLKTTLAYRPHLVPGEDDGLRLRHRVHADIEPHQDLGPVRFGYRGRLQHRFGPEVAGKTRVRNRLSLGWLSDGPWKPWLSGEAHTDIGDAGLAQAKLRLTVGTKVVMNHEHGLEVFLRGEFAHADSAPPLYILGLAYGLSTPGSR